MERGVETGFKDKFGRSIHVDDVVQHRLGMFGKASGGPSNKRVILFSGKPQLVGDASADTKYGGTDISEKLCEYLVVLRCNHMPT